MTGLSQVIVATGNAGKYAEIAQLLQGIGITPIFGADLGLPEPEETGTTFEANAIIKAEAARDATGRACLADDSGFCVVDLGDAPGVLSARVAIQPDGSVSFPAAMKAIAEDLARRGAAVEGARAWFGCAISLALPGGAATRTWFGQCHGSLAWPLRGDSGFGYDPMFVPDEQPTSSASPRTFGEMSSTEKHGLTRSEASGESLTGISHRARAFCLMLADLAPAGELRGNDT